MIQATGKLKYANIIKTLILYLQVIRMECSLVWKYPVSAGALFSMFTNNGQVYTKTIGRGFM